MQFKDKLFKIFFKDKAAQFDELAKANSTLSQGIFALKAQVDQYQEQVGKTPTIAEFMRRTLGMDQVDFSGVDAKGNTPGFFDVGDDVKRQERILKLKEVHDNPVFQQYCKYLTDLEGNYILRFATLDSEIYAGRFNISGIKKVVEGMNEANDLWLAEHPAKEEFDPHAITPEVDVDAIMRQ